MRKNFSDIGFFPQPVLVIGTYAEAGIPNAMNVGWGGMCGSRYVNINISRRHKTTDNIFSKKAFTMSFADQAHLVEADYFGLISGAEEMIPSSSRSHWMVLPPLNTLPSSA